MKSIKVFLLSWIRGYRVIERRGNFIAQKHIQWEGWKGIGRDGDLHSSMSSQEDYCAENTFEKAVTRYYDYLDKEEKKRKANKTLVHAMPPLEPKAWRLLKEKNEQN